MLIAAAPRALARGASSALPIRHISSSVPAAGRATRPADHDSPPGGRLETTRCCWRSLGSGLALVLAFRRAAGRSRQPPTTIQLAHLSGRPLPCPSSLPLRAAAGFIRSFSQQHHSLNSAAAATQQQQHAAANSSVSRTHTQTRAHTHLFGVAASSGCSWVFGWSGRWFDRQGATTDAVCLARGACIALCPLSPRLGVVLDALSWLAAWLAAWWAAPGRAGRPRLAGRAPWRHARASAAPAAAVHCRTSQRSQLHSTNR